MERSSQQIHVHSLGRLCECPVPTSSVDRSRSCLIISSRCVVSPPVLCRMVVDHRCRRVSRMVSPSPFPRSRYRVHDSLLHVRHVYVCVHVSYARLSVI